MNYYFDIFILSPILMNLQTLKSIVILNINKKPFISPDINHIKCLSNIRI